MLREELPLQSLCPVISVCLPGLPCGTLQLPSRCYVLKAALLAPRLPQSCTQLPQVEAPRYMARQAADAARGASLPHARSLAGCCYHDAPLLRDCRYLSRGSGALCCLQDWWQHGRRRQLRHGRVHALRVAWAGERMRQGSMVGGSGRAGWPASPSKTSVRLLRHSAALHVGADLVRRMEEH